MTYYRVKKEYDQHKRGDGSFLIENELYTKAEMKKYNIAKNCCEVVEYSQNDVYFCFGARFYKEDILI